MASSMSPEGEARHPMNGNRTRYSIWQRVSQLNERHGLFAWASLIAVGLTDLYVRLVASGAIHDVRFF